MNDDNYLFNRNLNQFEINNSYWQKYDSLLNSMSSEQKIFVSKQEEVIKSKQILISAFIDYLFEQNKNSFIATSDLAKKLADDYYNCVSQAASGFVTHSEQLEKENEELKRQLKQLLSKSEGKNDNRNSAK